MGGEFKEREHKIKLGFFVYCVVVVFFTLNEFLLLLNLRNFSSSAEEGDASGWTGLAESGVFNSDHLGRGGGGSNINKTSHLTT